MALRNGKKRSSRRGRIAANSAKISAIERLKPFRFRPGQSGNPEGRPRGTRDFAELIAERTQGGLKIIEHAIAVLEGKRRGNKQWACEFLAERMLGRAPQAIELTGKDGGPIELGDARERLIARLAAVLVPVEGPTEGAAALPPPAAAPVPS